MRLSNNFTLEELTHTNHNVSNIPNEEEVEELKKLCKEVLQPVREKYGKAIVVNSGFRNQKLNNIVKGSKRSQHLKGQAADIESAKRTVEENKRLFDLMVSMVEDGTIQVGQLIDEYNYSWIHVSTPTARLYNQILHLPR